MGTNNSSMSRSWRRRVVALVVGATGALLIAELALRLHNPLHATSRAHEIVLPLRKSFRTELRGNPKLSPVVEVRYNSIGFRGPEPPPDFAQRTTIVTVGGSTTECVGLTDGATWPDHVRRILEPQVQGLWLDNAGFNGHSSYGHVVLVEKVLTRLRPDVAVFLVGVNDVERGDLNDWDSSLDPSRASLCNRLIDASELLSTVQTIYRTMRAFDLGVHDEVSMDFAKLPAWDGPLRDRGQLEREHTGFLATYRTRLEAIVAACRGAGIRPVFSTQPALYGEAVDPTTGVDLGRRTYHGQRSATEQWRILELYNDVTRSVAKRNGIDLIDLARELPKDSRYYNDWIHYSLEGAAVVGELIAAGLLPMLPH